MPIKKKTNNTNKMWYLCEYFSFKRKNYVEKKNTLVFINSKTSKIWYNKKFEFSISKVINYSKDLLLLGCYEQIYLFNWKKYELIKTINCKSLDEYDIDKYFFQPYLIFNEYIIAERGQSGYGCGQESLKIFKIIHNNDKIINENKIKVFEEIQDLGLKNKKDDFSFIIHNNMIYIKFEYKKLLVYEINQNI